MNTMGFIKPNKRKTGKNTKVKSFILGEEYPHAMVVGETGCGKTSSILLPQIDEIMRTQKDAGMLIFDYKGNLSKKVKALAKKHNRLEKIREVGTIWGYRINVLSQDFTQEQFENQLRLNDPLNQDRFWIDNAVNMVAPLYGALTAIRKLRKEAKRFGLDLFKEDSKQQIVLEEISKLEITYQLLYNLVNSKKRYESIVNAMENFLDATHSNMAEIYEMFGSYESAYQKRDTKLLRLYVAYKKMDEAIEKLLMSSKVYVGYEEDNRTLQSIIATVQSVIGDIARTQMCNRSELDIYEALNNGDIVIVNTLNIPNAVIPHIVSVLNHDLRKRFSDVGDLNCIYLFFDEAQRLLTPRIDLAMDVLREAKVHIMLLFQNTSLLMDAIGENRFFALANNTPLKIAMKSERDPYNIFKGEVERLQRFEYFANIDDFTQKFGSNPIFFDKKVEYEAEMAYQRVHRIHEKFGIYEKDGIVLNDIHIFHEGKIRLMDEKNRTWTVDFFPHPKEFVKLHKKMVEILKDIEYAEVYEYF